MHLQINAKLHLLIYYKYFWSFFFWFSVFRLYTSILKSFCLFFYKSEMLLWEVHCDEQIIIFFFFYCLNQMTLPIWLYAGHSDFIHPSFDTSFFGELPSIPQNTFFKVSFLFVLWRQ